MAEHKQDRLTLGERIELALSVFIHAFIRFLLILAVIFVVGLAIYYGFPFLYQQYILPVQTNTTHLQEIQTQEASDILAINQRLDPLQARIAILEQQSTQDKETISDLQSRLNTAESLLNSHTTALKELDQIQSQITQLNQELTQNQTDIANMNDRLTGSDSPLAVMAWDVQTLKAMELLSRARLYLIQNNAGFARQDVEAARLLLSSSTVTVPADQQAGLTTLLARLDLVLGNLPSSPVTAADDLEIAWRQLSAGLANNPDALFSSGESSLAGTTLSSQTPTPGETTPASLSPTVTPTGTAQPHGSSNPALPTLKTTPTRTAIPTGTPFPSQTPTATP